MALFFNIVHHASCWFALTKQRTIQWKRNSLQSKTCIVRESNMEYLCSCSAWMKNPFTNVYIVNRNSFFSFGCIEWSFFCPFPFFLNIRINVEKKRKVLFYWNSNKMTQNSNKLAEFIVEFYRKRKHIPQKKGEYC